ncbi:MAG TPA: hypothetical protein VNQ97_02010 [Burkholderiaceae bacterium]|nr:hypothetical protein [Burkholderiaceae bacterium]
MATKSDHNDVRHDADKPATDQPAGEDIPQADKPINISSGEDVDIEPEPEDKEQGAGRDQAPSEDHPADKRDQ